MPQPRFPFYALLACAALTAAVFLAYGGSYQNTFLYDDYNLIISNQFLRDWHYLPTLFTTPLMAGADVSSSYYRPLQSFLYMLVFQTAGLSTGAFHLLNISLHALNGCLMFWLGTRLKFNPFAVFFAALLWAVHPVHTEAVTYISATADPLYAAFCLVGLITLLPDFSPRRVWASIPFFILALMSKESAIIFPFLAASLIYVTTHDRLNFRHYIRLWPLVLVGMLYMSVRFFVLSDSPAPIAMSVVGSPDSVLAGLKPFAALPLYLRLLVWPHPLYMEHEINAAAPLWPISVCVGIILVVAAWLQLSKKQTSMTLPFSWGIMWCGFAFAPVANFGDIAYEHWLYLPMVGLFLGVAQTIALLAATHARLMHNMFYVVMVPVFAVSGVFGFLTWQQNKIWHDPVVFYGHIIAQGDASPMAHDNLGTYYLLQGDYDEALGQFDLALQDYARSSNTVTVDNRANLHNNVAVTLQHMPDGVSRQNEILHHLQLALAIDPNNILVLTNLADIYTQQGDVTRVRFYQDQIDALHHKFKTSPVPNAVP